DVWLMLGDNAYTSGLDIEYQKGLFNIYTTLQRTSFLWPTIGNHDTNESINPPPSLPYFQIFSVPTNGEAGGNPSGTEKYYSFDFGQVHFICLDSQSSDKSANGAMAQWLVNDLNMPSTKSKRWIIAYFHHPPYTHGSHNSDTSQTCIDVRTNIAPILENGGVDLVLSGHSHSYERSVLLDGHYGVSSTLSAAMKLDPGSGRIEESGPYVKPTYGIAPHEGTVYVVAGSSGKTSGGPLDHPAMYTGMNTLGSVVLDVSAGRLDSRFLDSTGLVRDHFTIVKGRPSVSITSPAPTAVLDVSEELSITAAASAQAAEITKVEFLDGETVFAEDTDASDGFSATFSSQTPGKHEIRARATDSNTARATSAPVFVYVVENKDSAGAARRASDGTAVSVHGLVVSLAVEDEGFFYAQQPDGSAGLRIDSASVAPVGAKIDVRGIVATLANGERALTDALWSATGTGPLVVRGTKNASVGGSGYIGDSANLTNQGLLVRAWGRVTKVSTDYFLMDDGSDVPSGDTEAGIKVIGAPLPAAGDYVTVVGVVASEAADGGYIRLLRAVPEP
ncbi:MAG: metallophosphoesterase, partial [Armatimonadetes bacterium]|nr:metallophosphoesterase [Armatimonadota bacterium]